MKNELYMVAGAIPTTILIMSTVGGATAQITQANRTAVDSIMLKTAVALVIAAAISGSVGATVSVALASAATVWLMRQSWEVA